MTAIHAIIERGSLLLQSPLPVREGKIPAMVVISDESDSGSEATGLPVEKLGQVGFAAEGEFEAIGLRDFFGDPVDEKINWENFFKANS
jgi:hypothetical protein